MFFKESNPVHVILSAWGWSFLFAFLSGYLSLPLYTGFALGFCSYTFTEYFIHCFLFHIVSLRIKWPSRLYYKVHGRHHKFPNQYERVVLPLAHQWGLVAILFTYWYCVIFALELSLPSSFLPFTPSYRFQNACVLGSGIMFGYSFYEIAHLYSHGYPLLKWCSFLESAKWFHIYHHNQVASKNYGFVSPVWDWCFGTICTEEELNPFIKPKFGWNFLGVLAALPLPIPFYHFILLHYRNKGKTFASYNREKQEQSEYFG